MTAPATWVVLAILLVLQCGLVVAHLGRGARPAARRTRRRAGHAGIVAQSLAERLNRLHGRPGARRRPRRRRGPTRSRPRGRRRGHPRHGRRREEERPLRLLGERPRHDPARAHVATKVSATDRTAPVRDPRGATRAGTRMSPGPSVYLLSSLWVAARFPGRPRLGAVRSRPAGGPARSERVWPAAARGARAALSLGRGGGHRHCSGDRSGSSGAVGRRVPRCCRGRCRDRCAGPALRRGGGGRRRDRPRLPHRHRSSPSGTRGCCPSPWWQAEPWTPHGATLDLATSLTWFGTLGLLRPVLLLGGLLALSLLVLAGGTARPRWAAPGGRRAGSGPLAAPGARASPYPPPWRCSAAVVLAPAGACVVSQEPVPGASQTACVPARRPRSQDVKSLNDYVLDLRAGSSFQGADVGADVLLEDGRRLWVFGDTLRAADFDGQKFVRNSMLVFGADVPGDGAARRPRRADPRPRQERRLLADVHRPRGAARLRLVGVATATGAGDQRP